VFSIFQVVREIAQNAAAAVGEVVAADAAVVDSVATTAMRNVFRAGATRGERNGPAAEQAPMAQRTRHGRPSDKGQKGSPAIGLLWARYRRAKCLLSGEDFHRHRRSKCFHGSEILQ
jgi:hypothetical protein